MHNSRSPAATALLALAALISLPGCLTQQARVTPEATLEAPAAVEPRQTADLAPPASETVIAVSEPQAIAEPAAPVVVAEVIVEEPVLAGPPLPPPVDDVWERIRRGMQLAGHDHPGVANDLAWFARHQAYLDRVAERATPYLFHIVEEVERRGLPTELALLPVVESAFQPFAYSHGRAAGIWQFVPGTGRRFGLKQTWWYDGRRDIAESTRAALDYLVFLNREFGGDWLLALAAYNSGEGTVLRAIRNNRRKGKPTDFWSLDLPRETRGYVPKLLAISAIVERPEHHDVSLKAIPNDPFLTAVAVGSQIDMDLAAELAGISLEEIYRYNPAFNRWATDPEGPHRLLVPVDKAAQFEARVAELPDSRRIQWVRHRIRSGDSLGTIADRYRTTVALLKSVNRLRTSTIRAGDTLVIPVARKDLKRYRLSEEQRVIAQQERPRKGSKMEYIVQNGDTLWDIAREYDVSVDQLAKWNGMAPRDTLQPGRRLVIWSQGEELVSQRPADLTPSSFVHPHSDSLRQRIGYTVRSGDSLALISQKFRVSVADLQRWNRIGAKPLQPGQRLTLYVDVTTQSGSI